MNDSSESWRGDLHKSFELPANAASNWVPESVNIEIPAMEDLDAWKDQRTPEQKAFGEAFLAAHYHAQKRWANIPGARHHTKRTPGPYTDF